MKVYAQFTALAVATLALVAAQVVFMAEGATSKPAMIAAMVDTHLVSGDKLTAAARDFDAARLEYGTALQLVRGEGRVPVEPMRRIANAYYFQFRYERALKTLDELAHEAATAGEVIAEVWATADAAYIAGLVGDEAGADARLARLDWLINSPELSDQQRQVMEAKLSQELPVFAPHLPAW